MADKRIITQWYYRDSLYEFFLEAWKVLEPSTPLRENFHLRVLADYIQNIIERVARREPREADVVINIPPATTKSTLVTVVAPVWAWIIAPHLKIISVSYADTLAHYHAAKSRDIINSEWFQYYFGDIFQLKRDVNMKSEYANNKQGYRYAVGSGGAAIGRHADLVFCDDPINPRKTASPVDLMGVNEWWDNYISSRLTDPYVSVKFVIMQRLAVGDLSDHCLSKGNYDHVCLPAELTEDVKPASLREFYTDGLLDPVRLSRPVLKSMLLALGSNGYQGQFLQTPVKKGGNIFKTQWFGSFDMTELKERARRNFDTLVWHFISDTAFTEKTSNDPTGVICYAKYQKNYYVRDYEDVYMEMPQLIEFFRNFTSKNEYTQESTIRIEPKASGLSLIQMLKSKTELNVMAAKAPTQDKITRANTVAPSVEAGRVYLLDGAGWTVPFLASVTSFPNAIHDEAVDCLYMMLYKDSRDAEGSLIGFRSVNYGED